MSIALSDRFGGGPDDGLCEVLSHIPILFQSDSISVHVEEVENCFR